MSARVAWGSVAAIALSLSLLGCAPSLPVSSFGAPAFDPVRFYTGHVRSWGVVENRSGEPVSEVSTDCRGEADGPDGLRMTQTLTMGDGKTQTREWRMRRVAPNRYEATANDMVGVATGESGGRAFHWTWTLATEPGNPLLDVSLEQWMYFHENGTMVNRTMIRKLGVLLAQVTEQFERAPP